MRLLGRHFEEGVSVLLGVLLFAAVLWQVFTRYVLNDPNPYSEEAARYLYVGVVFFGAAAAVRDRTHVGIPFIVEKLPRGLALAVSLAMQALVLAFCLLIVVWGVRGASAGLGPAERGDGDPDRTRARGSCRSQWASARCARCSASVEDIGAHGGAAQALAHSAGRDFWRDARLLRRLARPGAARHAGGFRARRGRGRLAGHRGRAHDQPRRSG